MLGTLQIFIYTLYLIICVTIPRSAYYYLHFTDSETEGQNR